MKEALKLALEALVCLRENFNADQFEWGIADEAITAIKEALAQDEQSSSQEPVAWEQFYPDIGKPQLGQEPVAIYRAGQAKGEGFHVEFLKEMGDDEVLLYTTPPKEQQSCDKRPWLGLTDKQFQAIKDRLFRQDGGWDGHGWDLALKEAVEAKLKELNT